MALVNWIHQMWLPNLDEILDLSNHHQWLLKWLGIRLMVNFIMDTQVDNIWMHWSSSSSQKEKYIDTICFKNECPGGERERWQRNRTGRSLSPSQIPQKNISTPSKLHKTTSVSWQRTSGNQKSRPLSSKTGREKYKRRKRRQRRWGGSSVPGREARPGKGILRKEVSKHQETLSLPSLWRALETQRAT